MAPYWIYFGTSTGPTTPEMNDAGIKRSEGIYVAKFAPATGAISDVRLALKAAQSGFIATLPEKNRLYFIGAVDPKDGANAYACEINPKNGDLTLINGKPTDGAGVCHVSVRPDGKFLTAANYSSGDYVVFKLNDDGSIGDLTAKLKREGSGPNKRRQDHPYGHAAYFVETDGVWRFFGCDLGSDRIDVAVLDEATGKLADDPQFPELKTPAGAGPRHLDVATDANGNLVVFSINELDSTLSVFRLDFANGEQTTVGTWSTLEDEFREKLTDEETLVDGKTYLYGNKTAEIAALKLPSGKTVVYATNRGQDTLVAFDATDVLAGKSDFPLFQRISTQGRFPRYFAIDPTGRYLIVSNKKSGTIFTYEIDQENGTLTAIGSPTQIAWVVAAGFAPIAE